MKPLPLLLPYIHTHMFKVKEDGIKVMLSGIGADELLVIQAWLTLKVSIASKILHPLLNYFSEFSFFQNEIGSILTQK